MQTSPVPSSLALLYEQIQRDLVGQQWPSPALYVVATPIGNLTDLSPRARYALTHADLIAAEDTRATRVLTKAWQIETPLVSLHRHNEQARLESILSHLEAGKRIALVSDAGAPAVSDPGGHLVQAARAHGYTIVPIPGPTAIITALMAFGTTTDQHPQFSFLGFLGNRSTQRQRQLAPWLNYEGSLLCFVAPHRLRESLKDLLTVFGPHRKIGLARELTKRFEETALIPLSESLDWVTADTHREQGEYVLLVAPADAAADAQESQDNDDDWVSTQARAWINALLETQSVRDVARLMARVLGQPRDRCYAWLLAQPSIRKGDGGQDAQ